MIKELLEKNQKRLKASQDYLYFKKNRNMLYQYEFWNSFYLASTKFNIIQANIIIKSLLNKQTIEEYFCEVLSNNPTKDKDELVINLKNKVEKLNHFDVLEQKIFVPIFDRANNLVYYEHILRLGDYPYNLLVDEFAPLRVNLFDYYGTALYDSEFTQLVKIASDKTSTCFYHYQYKTLFFINNQGYLDYELALFDKYLKVVDYDNLFERLSIIAQAYYKNDRDLLISELVKCRFISIKLRDKITKNLAKFYKKRNKILGKGVANVDI